MNPKEVMFSPFALTNRTVVSVVFALVLAGCSGAAGDAQAVGDVEDVTEVEDVEGPVSESPQGETTSSSDPTREPNPEAGGTEDLEADCTTWLADGRFLISGYAPALRENVTPAERSIAAMADAGYTHIGPIYDLDPAEHVAEAIEADVCLVYHLGDPDVSRADAVANQDRWLADVRSQLEDVVANPSLSDRISLWMLLPEELDANSSDAALLITRLGQLIDDVDPLGRPVGMFTTSNTDEIEFSAVVNDLDAVVQGQYLVNDGRPYDRAEISHRTNRAASFGDDVGGAFVIPALEHGISDENIDPGDEQFIETWVRHDVRAVMASGGDGFLSFSHSERGRPEVFERYAEAFLSEVSILESAGLLAGPLQTRPLDIEIESGPPTQPVVQILSTGDRVVDWSSGMATELVRGDLSWVMIINHSNERVRMSVSGLSTEYREVGTDRRFGPGPFEIELEPFEAVLGGTNS